MEQQVTIERMTYGPAAVGHLPSGKAVFVEGAAPGETVSVEVEQDKKTYARARLVRVVEPSDARATAGLRCTAACGGCPWRHLSYEAQLAAKRSAVVDALVRTAHMGAARADGLVAPCMASRRQDGYRNKLELGVSATRDGKFNLGFREEGSRAFAAVDRCPIAHKKIERAPKALRGALRFVQGSADLGLFRVGVRHSLSTGELEVALWTRPGTFPRALAAKVVGDALPTTSIVRVLADPGSARKVKGVETLAGRGWWRERMGECLFSTQAPSFFQVNTAQAQRLVDAVIEGLGGEDALSGQRVADLYAGGGTFSIPLALAGADVVAVEASGSSVRDLRFNAELNQVYLDVVGGDAAHELSTLGALDALVVDPPRAGLAETVPADIAKAGPRRVAYVSCDPQTLARDVARFEQLGYELVSARPVDMFPQTFHVETVALLSRR
ncbi:MAG: 23S rRNA (uracil(1939)-C(5))-methyltransferase RlmD [Eggerthellaceae bacterium]|jgi:23S rRNA (uracil1939-C5)-methyltransferase